MAAQDLCTLANVRESLELETDETPSRDTKISTLITDASEAILKHCKREFAPVTDRATRRFRVNPQRRNRDGAYVVDLKPYDLRTVEKPDSDETGVVNPAASVTLHPEQTTPVVLTVTTEYLLDTIAPSDSGVFSRVLLNQSLSFGSTLSDNFGFAYLDIAGAWGFATVPENAKRAAIVTVEAWLSKPIAQGITDDARPFTNSAPSKLDLPLAALRLLNPYCRASFA